MSQKKKDKLKKMEPIEALAYLKSRFVNFLSGVEPYPLQGVEIDYRNNGTFQPTDESVRNVFIDCDRKWRHYVNSTPKIPLAAKSKFQMAFRKEISETWKRHSQAAIAARKRSKKQS